MKTLILIIALIPAITTFAYGQDAKAQLRDFTPKYTIDTFSINGETSYLKRRVIQFQNSAGIRSAYWDDASNVMTVQYNNKLVQLASIKNFFFNNQPLTNVQQEQKKNVRVAFVCCLVNPHSITIKN